MADVTRDLVDVCQDISADGTDPALLAQLLGWSVRPRRSLDALRRMLVDSPGPDIPASGQLHRLLRDRVDDDDRAAARGIAVRWRELGCVIAVVGDRGYPPRLGDGWPAVDAPLWWVGRGDHAANRPQVAIVGSRRASAYGTGIAAWLAEAVGDAGGRVVSGGAVGIDAAAHRAAVSTPGGTTIVLGCGHGVPYPRAHATAGGLFDEVLANAGAIGSELLPDEAPRPAAVRARNRVVAGLVDVVVVVEGGERSGALITASAAADRGRSVLAVPGDVRAPGSAAPHRLLFEGAAPCTSPAELLEVIGRAQDVGADSSGTRDQCADGSRILPAEVHRILVGRWPRPLRLDELAAESGTAIGSLLGVVTRAEVAGVLTSGVDGVRLRRAPKAEATTRVNQHIT